VQQLSLWKKKPVNITYSQGVFVALGFQNAMRLRHIVICGLPGSAFVFPPPSLINGTFFFGGKRLKQNLCFDFLNNFCLKYFSF
jgi:hypothetical protein